MGESAERNTAEEAAFRESLQAVQNSKAKLTAKLSELKTNLEPKVVKAEEAARSRVEEVKESYTKKLEATKQALKLKASSNVARPAASEAIKSQRQMIDVERKIR